MNNIKRYKILYRLKDNSNINYQGLFYRSEFELLIAVLLSAQARDIQVNKVTQMLFEVANTPSSMLLLGFDKIKHYIQCIGLYNTKAKNIIKTCQLLINRHNHRVPANREELEMLPGIGRKSANIILNVIFGRSTIAVDTHVFRVCNRSRFAVGNNVKSVEQKLISVVPKKFQKSCHQWLVEHGRYTCQAKYPKCVSCIIQDLCEFDKKTI